MIVIGYPGIGKSTLATQRPGYIDLDSSSFYDGLIRPENWFIFYCQVAESLSRQGNVVFVSSHRDVQFHLLYSDERVVCIYPSILLKDKWINRLQARYNATGIDKDYRALTSAISHFDADISALMVNGMPHREIGDMKYSLHGMIEKLIEQNPEIEFNAWKIECGGGEND